MTEFFPMPTSGPQMKPEPPGRTITEEIVTAYAHCGRILRGCELCPGHEQEPVQAVQTTVTETLGFRNDESIRTGVAAGLDALLNDIVEGSWTSVRFADAEDLPCPHCGKPRELTTQERPNYPILVGGRDALLRVKTSGAVIQPERVQAIAAGSPETPLETLQRRYVNGEVELPEFRLKSAVLLGGPLPDSTVVAGSIDPATDAPEGIRQRGENFQATWRDSEGKQRSATFPTLDEAIEARQAALAEREAQV